jgi:hypothetical protein
MRKRALALWPKQKKEPIPAEQPDQWVQEEEVQKLRLQQVNNPSHREKLQQLLPGVDLKRWVL